MTSGNKGAWKRAMCILSISLACCVPCRSQTAWEWRQPAAGADLFAFEKGNGVIVAVGSATLSVSKDGRTWNSVIRNTFGNYHDLAFGAGKFLVTSDSGKILTSPDGAAWTAGRLPARLENAKVRFGNGKFLALGDLKDRLIAFTSADGITWTGPYLDVHAGVHNLSFGNGIFVAKADVDMNPWCYYSGNGVDWDGRALGNMNVTIDFYHDRFLFNHTYDQLSVWYHSADAVTLTRFEAPYPFSKLAFLKGTYFLYGLTTMHSTDFKTWTKGPSVNMASVFRIRSDSSSLLALSGDRGFYASTDGSQWSMLSEPAIADRMVGLVHGDGKFVALGFYGDVATSPDGRNWTRTPPLYPFGLTFTGFAFHNHTYLAYGNNGRNYYLLVSPDGVDWTQYDAPITGESVTFAGQDSLILISGSGGLFYSTDGAGWGRKSDGTNYASSIIQAGKECLINLQRISIGPTGPAWSPIKDYAMLGRIRHVAHGNGKYVGVGNRFVAVSEDLQKWVVVDSTTPLLFKQIVFAKGQFVALTGEMFLGYDNAVVTSPDGVVWTKHHPGVRSDLVAFAHDQNQILVGSLAGGIMGSVFGASQGIAPPRRESLPGKRAEVVFARGQIRVEAPTPDGRKGRRRKAYSLAGKTLPSGVPER